MNKTPDRRLGEGLDGYTHADDGIASDTYVSEDLVVQCLPASEYDEITLAYLVLTRIRSQPLSAVRVGATGQEGLAAVASASEAPGQVHAADGEGYGEVEARSSGRPVTAAGKRSCLRSSTPARTATGPGHRSNFGGSCRQSRSCRRLPPSQQFVARLRTRVAAVIGPARVRQAGHASLVAV